MRHNILNNLGDLPLVQKHKMQRLLDYVSTYWVRQIGCEILSVYREIRRTNNDLESFHSALHGKVQTTHENFWTFVDVLVAMEDSERRDFLRLQNGQPVRAVKKSKYILQDKRILEATNKLDQGRYSTEEFLSFVSQHVKDFAATGRVGQRQEDFEHAQGDEMEDNPAGAEVEFVAPEAEVGPPNIVAEIAPVLDEPYEEGQNFGICPVCQFNRASYILEPCLHCCCGACGEELERMNLHCPSCRTIITNRRRFYL